MGEVDTYYRIRVEILLPDKDEELQNLMMDELSSEETLERFEKLAQAFFSGVAGEEVEVMVSQDYSEAED